MNLSSWMTENVSYLKYIGQMGNGEKKYEKSTLRCRIEKKDRITRNESGDLVVGSGVIFSLSKINNKDKIEYEGKEYEIINVNEYKKKNGVVSHYEGVLQ